MSYLGSVPSSGTPFSNNKIQVLSGNGSNTQFTLDFRVNSKADIEVIVNNVQQNPFDGSYDVSNNNILTFSGAPSSGANNIHIYFRGYSHNVSVPEANSINSNQLTTTGVTAGTYGNTTAIPVVTIDAAGRITSATTNSVSGVTGVSWTTANNTLTVSTSTVAYSANVSQFSNPVTVSNTLTTKAIVPDANVTHDIGTTLMRYKDLYLANSTIYIGTSTVSETAGALQISSGGNPAVNLATITQATNLAGNAYSNAIAYSGNAALAYANAIAYSANATNISSGTVAFARLPTQYIGTTAVQSTSAAQAVSGITTLAAGNTTITGFANVTSTIQGGSSLTIAGALLGVTTAAVGNTTITGFANVTSTLQVGGAVTFSNTLSVAGNVTGTAANVTIVAGLFTTTFANTGVTSLPGNTTIAGDLVVSGNLTTSGTTTYVNTTNLNVGDNIITLNADVTNVTAPTENAGFEVNRGSSANVALRWNETSDIWQTTTDGTNYLTVATNNDVSAAYSNAVAYAAANSYVNTQLGLKADLSGATFSGAVSGITTLAAGNTTISGFANVTGTMEVGGSALNMPRGILQLDTSLLANATSNGMHVRLNSSGSYWGAIGNPATQVWGLGRTEGTGNTMVYTALSWAANNNVGINTVSPAYTLDVNGLTRLNANTIINGTATVNQTLFANNINISGVGTSGWSSEYKIVQGGTTNFPGALAFRGSNAQPYGQTWLTMNAYRETDSTTDTTGWKTIGGHYATAMVLGGSSGNTIRFLTTGWTASGTSITWNTPASIDSSGITTIGTTSNTFFGKSYSATSSNTSMAIVDTGITYSSYGSGSIYQVYVTGNPNVNGSGSYLDILYGKIHIGTGYNGSVCQFIYFVQENPPRPYGSGGSELTIDAVFVTSGTESTYVADTTSNSQIRLKVGFPSNQGVGAFNCLISRVI